MSSWLYLEKSFVTSSLISNRNELRSTLHAHGGMAAENDKRCYYNKKNHPVLSRRKDFPRMLGTLALESLPSLLVILSFYSIWTCVNQPKEPNRSEDCYVGVTVRVCDLNRRMWWGCIHGTSVICLKVGVASMELLSFALKLGLHPWNFCHLP